MRRVIFYLLFTLLLGDIVYAQNSCSDYSYLPPTFVSQVPPTVMIALDTSGSMDWDSYVDNHLDSSKTYEGLFNPQKKYKKVNGVWQETTSGSAATCPSPNGFYVDSVGNPVTKVCYSGWFSWNTKTNEDCIDINKVYSGNCLNYWLMSRMDVFQWAMTGGKPAGCTSNNSRKCDAARACTGSNCDIETGGGVVVRVPMVDNETYHGIKDAVLYQLMERENRPRIGIMTYSGSHSNSYINAGVYIGDFTSAQSVVEEHPYTNLITAINTASPEGGTPSGPAMWDVWNYYKQEIPEYGGLQPNTSNTDNSNQFKDPLWICENTDNGLKCDYAPCSSNYVILASDGQWNTPSTNIYYNCSDPLSDACRSSDPVVPAYKMHMGATRDKDGATVKIDAVYTLGLFLGGTGEQSLKNVAMYGSFDKSLSGGLWPDSLTNFPNDTCYMDDGGSGRGSACEPLPASSSDWDQDGNDLPDTFFSANNALELKDRLQSIFNDILKRASSGTALSSVSTGSQSSLMLFQAFYYPTLSDDASKREISWVGDVRSYFVDDNSNIREDTDNNKTLNYAADKILILKFFEDVSQTMALKIDDNDEDQIPDSCTLPSGRYDLMDLNTIFSASKWLQDLDSDSRTIMYNDGTPNKAITNNFTPSNVTTLKNYWGITTDSEASKLINFIRGYDYPRDNNYRKRNFLTTNASEVFKGVYKLGDIINSTPIILSNTNVNRYHNLFRDSSYYEFANSSVVKGRKPVIFFGANDGMVHAISIGKIEDINLSNDVAKVTGNDLGAELWAFIPQNALPYLQWYNIEGSNCHVPKIDYRFQLVDVAISGTGEKNRDSWRTLLIGTMGFGGKEIKINNETYSSSIFVIDVTDPERAKFLWERKLTDNSLTINYPAIIRQGDKDERGSWYLVVGSGPLDPSGGNFVKNPKIYFYNLIDGTLVNTVTIPEKDVAVGEILSVDVDFDYNIDALVFGTYSAPNTEKGNLYMLHIRSNASNYLSISNLDDSNVEMILNINRPIFAMPTDVLDESNNLWIYAGTGRFLSQNDKIDHSTQYIFGIKDKNQLWKGGSGATLNISDLYDSTDITVEAYINQVDCYCLGIKCGGAYFNLDTNSYECSKGDPVVTDTYGDLTNEPKADGQGYYSVSGLANYLYIDKADGGGGYSGWVNEITDGKRVYSKLFVAGGIVDALVFEPQMDLCSYGGQTKLQGVYYKTGTPASKPMFLNSGQTISIVTENGESVRKIEISKVVDLGFGAPPLGEGITAMPQKEGSNEYTKMIQLSDGSITRQTQYGDSFSSKLILMITR
ncbi:MAG: Tfp pilus assembly protein tip-associated adhesin PilY1-like protein [Deferribacteraceae bacterium]|jgi:type IV pilus assembly protein PilY1|nr:Tfp pilus assembly protein tip-associated adhesin PilY1-like protein [Deferribacteraceae bacterium]